MPDSPSPADRDHRSVQAEKKREQTRARLLAAALALCAADLRQLPTIEDIVEKARVSRGTFYKYFDSIEQLLAALGQDLTRLGLVEGERFRGVFREKWKSTSVVFRVVLTRALFDRTWASFVLRTRAWVHDSLLGSIVLQDLAEGIASGEYRVPDSAVALDFLRGVLESCIATLHRGTEAPDRYIDSAVYLWLQALGVEPALCEQGVAMSRRFIEAAYLPDPRPSLVPGTEEADANDDSNRNTSRS